MLRKMVKDSNAYSTQPLDLEDIDDLCNKCTCVSEKWAEVADELWEKNKKAPKVTV